MFVDKNDIGKLGVVWLKRLWQRQLSGKPPATREDAIEEWQVLHTVLAGLELALAPTINFLHGNRPSFEQFEDWVLAINGGVLDPQRVARLNATLRGDPLPPATVQWMRGIDDMAPVLDQHDLDHWDEHGWVLLKGAISPDAARDTAGVVWRSQGMDPDNPADWGRFGPDQQCVFVQVFRHPALDANRHSARIHKAFAQLWGRSDLWATTDRIGFNAPVSPNFTFPGPGIHWDVSLVQPVPFGIQGLVYLTDTESDQGAFALVPGMHRSLGAWLDSLPAGVNPREYATTHVTMTPIAGQAGDMVLWHHALAHGPTPNTAKVPRLVHYMTMFPADFGYIPEWA